MSDQVASGVVIVLLLAAAAVGLWGLRSKDSVRRLAAWCGIAVLVAGLWLIAQAQIAHYASR